MNYIEIDFKKVKGFKNLEKHQQDLFVETYKIHNSIQGNDYKVGYVPVSVNWVEDKEESRYSYLKVVFLNDIWLHYCRNKTWY